MNKIIWGGELSSTKETLYSNYDSDELYRHRNEIWFSCNVSKKSINKIIKLIHEAIHDDQLSAYKETNEFFEIIIHIDSQGGTPSSAFKFIDCVDQLKKKNIRFRTIINGRAASAATLMAIAGDKKHITKNSYAMIHELQCMAGGYHTHVKSYIKYLETLHNQIVSTYNDYRTPKEGVDVITVEKIEKWMAEETWFSAKEYLDLGFVDEIIQ